MTIEACFSSDEDENPGVISTSFKRELMYGIDHAIHHLAIVKIGIKYAFPFIKLNPELGIATSTLKFNRT